MTNKLGIPISYASPRLCDNQATIHIAFNLVLHEYTKHFDCHFILKKGTSLRNFYYLHSLYKLVG